MDSFTPPFFLIQKKICNVHKAVLPVITSSIIHCPHSRNEFVVKLQYMYPKFSTHQSAVFPVMQELDLELVFM
jgi:hypothetical protein